jgi:hypothetical protein
MVEGHSGLGAQDAIVGQPFGWLLAAAAQDNIIEGSHPARLPSGHTPKRDMTRPGPEGPGRIAYSRLRTVQTVVRAFSTARLTRPEIGAKASLASLSTASLFFEPYATAPSKLLRTSSL